MRGPCSAKVWESNPLLNIQRHVTIYTYPIVNPFVKQKRLVICLGCKCGFSYMGLALSEACFSCDQEGCQGTPSFLHSSVHLVSTRWVSDIVLRTRGQTRPPSLSRPPAWSTKQSRPSRRPLEDLLLGPNYRQACDCFAFDPLK